MDLKTLRELAAYHHYKTSNYGKISFDYRDKTLIISTDAITPLGILFKEKVEEKDYVIYKFSMAFKSELELLFYAKNKDYKTCYKVEMDKKNEYGKNIEYVDNIANDGDILEPIGTTNHKGIILIKNPKIRYIELEKVVINESSDNINKIFIDDYIIYYCFENFK